MAPCLERISKWSYLRFWLTPIFSNLYVRSSELRRTLRCTQSAGRSIVVMMLVIAGQWTQRWSTLSAWKWRKCVTKGRAPAPIRLNTTWSAGEAGICLAWGWIFNRCTSVSVKASCPARWALRTRCTVKRPSMSWTTRSSALQSRQLIRGVTDSASSQSLTTSLSSVAWSAVMIAGRCPSSGTLWQIGVSLNSAICPAFYGRRLKDLNIG